MKCMSDEKLRCLDCSNGLNEKHILTENPITKEKYPRNSFLVYQCPNCGHHHYRVVERQGGNRDVDRRRGPQLHHGRRGRDAEFGLGAERTQDREWAPSCWARWYSVRMARRSS